MMRPNLPSVQNALSIGAALVAAVLLAGCVGGAAEPVVAPQVPTETGTDGKPIQVGGWIPAKYDVAALHVSEWKNGTFQFQENNFPLGIVTWNAGMGDSTLRMIDLSDKVPKGVPVRLLSTVEAETKDGDVDIWFDVPFDELWSGTWDTPFGGHSAIELRLVHMSDEPIRAFLGYGEYDASTSFPYTWHVEVLAEPGALLEGVAEAVNVPDGGATLGIDLDKPGPAPAVLVWDPQDAFVGRFPIAGGHFETALPEGGDYVVMLAGGSGHGRVALKGPATASAPKIVKQDVVQHQASAPGPDVEWTFTADRVPLQAGFWVMAGTVSKDYHGSLQGPVGPLIESTFNGGPWVRPVMGFGDGEWTAMGAPGLAEGDYHAKAGFAQAAGDPLQYGDYLVYYER